MGVGQKLHVRVICNKASAEVSQQRGDLITAAGPQEGKNTLTNS